MIIMKIDRKLFIYLAISFIIATIVGTVSHEFGHYLIAKLLGFNAYINFGYTHWTISNPNQIETPLDRFLITLGGPIQTMLTGTIGLFFVYLFRNSFRKVERLSFSQWLGIYVSLFWLRQTANFCVWLSNYILYGQFSNRSDEIKIARHLGIPNWTITFFTALVGAIILIILYFRYIPVSQRLTFIISGLIGGVSGYILWLYILGPILMP